jgi:hypothetical protein
MDRETARAVSVGGYSGQRTWLTMRGWARRRVKVDLYPIIF